MRKMIEVLAIAAVVLIASGGPSLAGSKATIMVTASVMASISQSVIHQESKISITGEDLERGYVEIPSGTILVVKTNDRSGYFLFFEGANDLFKEVWITDKGRTTVLSPNGGLIRQSHSGGNVEVKDLSYRLHLKENTQPGLYPWPFRVKASLL